MKRVKLTDEELKANRKKYADRYRAEHREELRLKQLAYYRDHIEERRHYDRNIRKRVVTEARKRYLVAYRQKNKERIAQAAKQSWKAYYAKNRERQILRARQYVERNHERVKARHAKYNKEHPERSRRNNHRRRAITSRCPIGNVRQIQSWEAGVKAKKTVSCYWCGKRVPGRLLHMDHIVPLAKGGSHDIDNVAMSCARCNLTKSDKHPDEFSKTLKQKKLL